MSEFMLNRYQHTSAPAAAAAMPRQRRVFGFIGGGCAPARRPHLILDSTQTVAALHWTAYPPAVNWHQIIDERSYEMHQVIAGILRQSPEKLALVNDWIERRMSDPAYSIHSKDALQEWVDVIRTEGVVGVLRVLDARGEDATRMRQSGPFAILMPQEKRLEILNRYEARRPRAHPAGV